MHMIITLAISLCAGNVNMSEVAAKKAALEKQHPGAKVSVRIDKKCSKDE